MKTIEAPRADPKKFHLEKYSFQKLDSKKMTGGLVMDTITSSTGGGAIESSKKPSFVDNYQQNTQTLFTKMNSYVNKFETLS